LFYLLCTIESWSVQASGHTVNFCSGIVDDHSPTILLTLSLIYSHTLSLRHSRSFTHSVTVTLPHSHTLAHTHAHSLTHRSRQIVVLNNGLKRCKLKPLHIILRHHEYSSICLKELTKTDKILSHRPGVYTLVSRDHLVLCFYSF